MMFGFEPVFEGQHLRAALSPGTSGLLVVTFDYRRVTRKGFSEVNNSSTFARQGHGQLSVSCRVNDWFINPETEALERALSPIAARYDRVHAMGYSMGAYGAFRFARALRLKGIVAVSPQASIAPGVVPGDDRYTEEAKGFDPDLGDLSQRGDPDLRGILFVDPFMAVDMAHARLIHTAFPRVELLRLPFAGHPASRILRDVGKSWLLQRETVAPVPSATQIRRDWRQARRDSALYWRSLAEAATPRRPALATAALDRAALCEAEAAARRAEVRARQVEGAKRNAAKAQAFQTRRNPTPSEGETG